MNDSNKYQALSLSNTENIYIMDEQNIHASTKNQKPWYDHTSCPKREWGGTKNVICERDSAIEQFWLSPTICEPLQTTPEEIDDAYIEQPRMLLTTKHIHGKLRKWPLRYRRDYLLSENQNNISNSNTDNHQDDNVEVSGSTHTATALSESGEEEHNEFHTTRAKDQEEIDFDGDFEDADTYDLSRIDFECLTKPTKPKLTKNQLDYKRFCKRAGLVPNAHIVRSLNESTMTLSSQQMGPRGIKALCFALITNCCVTELEISEDDIDLKTMASICDMCLDNQFITHLDLSNNKLGRVAVKMLIEAIEEEDKLIYLNLTGNCLDDKDGDIFVRYIKNTGKLATLNLSYNSFRDEAPTAIGKALTTNGSIVELNLRWNHIRGTGVIGFLAGIAKNRTVETLDLSWNGLGGEGVKYLCQMIRKNSVISTLDISGNRINLNAMLDLFAALKKARGLVTLLIGNNLLSERHINDFLQEIIQFKGQFTLKNMSFGNSLIDFNTVPLVNRCRQEKDLMIMHGPVFGMKEKTVNDADELANLNPVTVLIEFGHVLGMSIRELFEYMDEDGSQTLSRQEIKDGLMEFDLPLPENSLDLLIRKMDSDGDGEISLNDLLKVNKQDTETVRCRKILKRLMAAHKLAKVNAQKKGKKKVTKSTQVSTILGAEGEDELKSLGDDDENNEKVSSTDLVESEIDEGASMSSENHSVLPPITVTNGVACGSDHYVDLHVTNSTSPM